jgi:hypothetical protein
MKAARTFACLVTGLILLVAPVTLATNRIVLVETFTNTGCPYCPANNTDVHNFMGIHGPMIALNVQYHTSGPSSSDPFYVANTTDNLGRTNYYPVPAVPTNEIDGTEGPTSGYNALKAAIKQQLLAAAPFEIGVSANTVANQITVDVSVKATDDVPASGLMLHIALVEPYVFTDPPGSDNGERNFFCTMRDMLPSYLGQTLTITNGQTLNFQETATLNPTWVDVYPVVWVQNNADKTVLQVASTLETDYAFFFGAPEVAAVAPMGLYSFPAFLQNRGLQSDTYQFHVDWDLPGGWGGGVCEGGTCHIVGDNDFTVRLGTDEEVPVSVDIEPFATTGEGLCTVTVTSQANPSLQWVETFKLISYGTPILLVDDDGGDVYEAYYQEALDTAGYAFGTWNLLDYGKLSSAELSHFPIVVWNVGWAFPSLDATDRAALAAFLDGGGRLFVSGQDIGWDFFDPQGSQYGVDAQSWYENYLGAVYVRDDTNDLTLEGTAGDPIGDGLAFSITGGSGASNQEYPSEINPDSGGVGCLFYVPDMEAAVRKDSGVFKSVYFAFGFEGIAEASVRATLMERILDWFDIDLVPVPGDPVQRPFLAGTPTASPNPFNPSTRIDLRIGGSGHAPVEVVIFDLRGRKVRSLWQGPLPAGRQSLTWDGSSDDGRQVASGAYLARVKVSGQEAMLKMTLAK